MPKTLLLADDSVTIQKVVGISFASEDITLVTVDNGTSAVAKAKEIRPDIVLADVVMPGLSGYEVCRQIKADPNLRHVPVLLLTGTFEAFDEAKAREVGSDGHITKPFEAQALVDLVNARLAAAVTASPAPAATAKGAPASTLFSDDEPFDFMGDEITAPNPAAAARGGENTDALSFGSAGELELGVDDDLTAAPLEVEALTQVVMADADSGVALFEDDPDENAETLPPVEDAEPFDDGPAATQVLFGEPEAAARPSDVQAATSVMFGEPEAAGVGTLTPSEAGFASDPFAELIGGTHRPAASHEVAATDLGDPFADDPELAVAPADPEPMRVAPQPEPAWPEDDDPFAPEPTAASLVGDEPAIELAPATALRPASGSASADALPTRDELRNMLEKMAWEAFGDVTDRIVRETVQRVEQIAWEVIPKMAETLIHEEIRRLKESGE